MHWLRQCRPHRGKRREEGVLGLKNEQHPNSKLCQTHDATDLVPSMRRTKNEDDRGVRFEGDKLGSSWESAICGGPRKEDY